MAYTFSEPRAGLIPIASTDAGITPPNSATVIPTPPLRLGMIVRASDPTYGEGEFILLAGVASTTVGSLVAYNATTYTTALAPVGTNIPRPIAVAMSANTSASTWGWYQISGIAVAAKSDQVTTASAAIGISTAGFYNTTTTSSEIQGAIGVATTLSASGTGLIVINRPHMMGRITA